MNTLTCHSEKGKTIDGNGDHISHCQGLGLPIGEGLATKGTPGEFGRGGGIDLCYVMTVVVQFVQTHRNERNSLNFSLLENQQGDYVLVDSSGQDKTKKNQLCSPKLYLRSSRCSSFLSIPVAVMSNQVKVKMNMSRN